MIDFYFQKLNLSIRFPSEIKVLSIDPAFSNWFFIKKFSMVKLEFFYNKPLSMCFCFFAYITLFQLSVGYVCLLLLFVSFVDVVVVVFVCSLVLLPYIHVKRRDRRVKLCVSSIALTLYTALNALLLLLLLNGQLDEWAGQWVPHWIHTLTCVPFTADFCSHLNTHLKTG